MRNTMKYYDTKVVLGLQRELPHFLPCDVTDARAFDSLALTCVPWSTSTESEGICKEIAHLTEL